MRLRDLLRPVDYALLALAVVDVAVLAVGRACGW